MEKETNLEDGRYKPQHPLPEEIRKMRPDDTVCQFCGVSYLIHNEIKSLQEKLDECKKEVERLKHYDEREKVLNDQVNTLNIKSRELLEKWQFEEKRNNEYEDLILKKNLHNSQLKQNVENYITNLNSVKGSCEDLRNQVKEVNAIAAKISMSSNSFRGELSKSYDMSQYDLSQFMDYWNKQKAAILEKVSYFVNLHNKSEEKNKLFQTDMDCQSMIYEKKIKQADMKYANLMEILVTCSRTIQKYERKIGLCIAQVSEIEKNNLGLCEKYSKKIILLNKKVHKLNKYLKIDKDNQNGDRMSLLESVHKYKEDNFQLTDERTRMINAHQHQIKQLHDSFREKLLEAEMWAGKHDDKMKEQQGRFDEEKSQLMQEYVESLNKTAIEYETKFKLLREKCKQDVKMQQRKFNEEKSQLLKEVTESYEKAASVTEERYNQMNEEKANHLKTIGKLEQHLESMQVKFHGEMLKQVEQHEKEKKYTVASCEHKIFVLKKQLDEGQSNISNEEKESSTRTIENLQSALSNAKEVIIEKLSCIEEYKNENYSLRDCVRRECEERFELTEALAEARSELLSIQRFSNKNKSPKQFGSPSQIYNQQSSSVNKLGEISKSSDKNVRLVELSKIPGNLDASKISLGNLPTSPGSVKSQNPGRSSSKSRYPKNKLKISLSKK